MTTETTCTHLLSGATSIAHDIIGHCTDYEGGNRSQVTLGDCLGLIWAGYIKQIDTERTEELTELVEEQLKRIFASVDAEVSA